MNRFPVIFFLILISTCIRAQSGLPKYYFRDPLDLPIQLAANFGELRAGHWHMGLDIRTNQKENQPVFAAAQGYIAHVGIRPQSFGRYIIINHPNGYSTLYAHLNDFYPVLEQYVTAEQYKRETWAIELDFPKNKFPVSRSQFIAFSGTTGGSQGPHLHFEIRDTKTDRCINPLYFGLPVKDDIAPDLVKLAMYDRSKSVFDQTPLFFPLKNTDSGWIIPRIPIIKTTWDKVSFSIQAYDRSTGSTNPNGICSAKLYEDEDPIISFALDSLNYQETTYINAHVDYKYRFDGGPFLQHLSKLPGDRGPVYKNYKDEGVISLTDTSVHAISIEIKDADRNLSVLNFGLQHDSLALLNDDTARSTTYSQIVFAPNQVNKFEKPDFRITIAENALYDSTHVFYFRTNSSNPFAVSALHQINDASIPVHSHLTVEMKPTRDISADWKEKLCMVQHDRTGNSVRKIKWDESDPQSPWMVADFGDFGTYQVLIDTIAPVINEISITNKLPSSGDTLDLSAEKEIVIDAHDNLGVIKNFRAELDGKWLRFSNDKNLAFVYEFDSHCPYGNHELKVTVEDLVGNVSTKSWLFKTHAYTPPKKVIKKKKKAVKKNESGKKKHK